MITEEWLFARSIPEPNTGCWLWLGSVRTFGYARYRQDTVGRLLLQLSDPEQCALHHCDQPYCVNPEHLYAGTRTQNAADMKRRNRAHRPFGNRYSVRKLTPELVIAIRKDPRTQEVIAAAYGLPQQTISDLKTRRRWGWLA